MREQRATAGGPSRDPFDPARSASAVVDSRGAVAGWSAGAELLLGHRAAEILGRPVSDLLLGAGEAGASAAADRRLRDGRSRARLVAARHKDGHRVELAVRVYRSDGPEGRPSWLVLAAGSARMREWEEDWAVLAGLFTQSPVGLLVSDTDLRCVRRNVALEKMTGVPNAERLGKRIGESLPELNAAEVEAAMRRVLATGKPVVGFTQFGHTPADPDHEHVWSTGIFRLQDSAGAVLGVCHAVVDVTDRHRSRERMAVLNEASLRIGTTLDVMRTAQELTQVAVPRLADTVTVDLLDAVLRSEAPAPGPAHEGVTLRRAGYGSSWTGPRREAHAVGELSWFAPDSPQSQCMADLQPRLVSRLSSAAGWLAAEPERAAMLAAAGAHSVVVAPLIARDVLMGVATFYRWQRPDGFDDDDLTLAAELASRAAVCIDNARRYTRERATALSLQRSLLPGGLPALAAVEAAGRYQPASFETEVGGDWFDVIALSGARVALVVGDVPGHGVHASAIMGRLRTAVHTLADLDLPPDELLTHLDDLVGRLVKEEEAAHDRSTGATAMGATCLYAVYDPVDRRCTLARAGHYPPAVLVPGGAVEFLRLPAGPPLGLGGLPFESTELDLPEGSLLVLFTNGLVQARDPDIEVGLETLRDLLQGPPQRPPAELCDEVTAGLLPFRPPDDVALLIARTRSLGPDQVTSWELPPDPAFVAQARTLVARQLTAWGLDDLQFTTELVVSELVTNAIRYGRSPIQLRLIRERTLICEVSDAGSTSPHLRRAHEDDEGGRGLFLVAQLTQRWGTRYTARGKTIWTEQPLP